VRLARTARPDFALTGDIMVGFPGETREDFQRTLDVVEWARFMDLHVFRFSPRPRTAAARYADQVPVAEARERSRLAIELGHRLGSEYQREFAGRPVDVIWDRVARDRIRGVSENYLTATAPCEGRRAGQLERVTFEPTA
jgi:threonylcarbamoyladenosine tRNA methylthiotransferase MtaB